VYRFLFTPRWLGILALTLVAAAVMAMLGNWQWSRYQERSAINERIDTTATMDPVPLAEVLTAPGAAPGTAGPPVPDGSEWTRVTATGRYDSANVILVRGRTVHRQVGFEVLTPLLLADGTAVLVDRGWVPPPPEGATGQPQVPPAPAGEVTVVGRVRPSESQPRNVSQRNGRIETRRIGVSAVAGELPYPLHGAYLLLDEQDPAADPAFSPIPVGHENNWQNLGYVVQWWLFALMTIVGYGWLARREARGATKPEDAAGIPARPGGKHIAEPGPAEHTRR